MSDELYNFILELIREVDNLQLIVDGECAIPMDVSDKIREARTKDLIKQLDKFKDTLK